MFSRARLGRQAAGLEERFRYPPDLPQVGATVNRLTVYSAPIHAAQALRHSSSCFHGRSCCRLQDRRSDCSKSQDLTIKSDHCHRKSQDSQARSRSQVLSMFTPPPPFTNLVTEPPYYLVLPHQTHRMPLCYLARRRPWRQLVLKRWWQF